MEFLLYKDRNKMKILSNLEMKFFSYIISMLSDVNGEMRGCQQCFFCDRVCLRISLILKLCDVGPGNTNSGKNKSLQALGNQDISANVRVSGRICGLVKTGWESRELSPLHKHALRVLAQCYRLAFAGLLDNVLMVIYYLKNNLHWI